MTEPFIPLSLRADVPCRDLLMSCAFSSSLSLSAQDSKGSKCFPHASGKRYVVLCKHFYATYVGLFTDCPETRVYALFCVAYLTTLSDLDYTAPNGRTDK
jgi:hypothetical protein